MEGRWVTINGAKVFINNKGDVVMGLGKASGSVGHISAGDFNNAIDEIYPGDDRDALDKRDEVAMSVSQWIKGESTTEQDIFLAHTIDKMPDNVKWDKGELYRGLTLSEKKIEQLQVGDSFKSRELSSWTSDKKVAEQFATYFNSRREVQRQVVLIDKTEGMRNAVSIKNYADTFVSSSIKGYKSESEVLSVVRSHTITKITNLDGVIHIEVKEAK